MKNLIDLSRFRLGGNIVEVTPGIKVGSEPFQGAYWIVFIQTKFGKHYLDNPYRYTSHAKNAIRKKLKNW